MSLHVQLADEAVCVGGARPQESYLNMKNILAAAIGTGAQAIHPEFGFLSENSKFAEMCQACGITFIGPDAKIIDLMGNKEHTRQQMKLLDVPVIPGSDDYIQDVNEAKRVAAKIGYPVLIKAAAGGVGKVIRRINDEVAMTDSFNEAQSEAKLAFGDDHMYIEKIMENVKHIEVQVFRDQAGHAVYFPERDCLLQINKQKVLEESPCQLVTEQERKQLGQIALRAINGIDYLNTGTIEFLMDQDHHFYFMEMNTRIQVEHTVTEMVTGIDLVKAQLKVAAGEDLPFDQSDIQIYDSMVAKVIALGHDRAEAIEKIKRLLNEMVIEGIKTNQEIQLAILQDPTFIKGDFTTSYLEKVFLKRWKENHSRNELVRS